MKRKRFLLFIIVFLLAINVFTLVHYCRFRQQYKQNPEDSLKYNDVSYICLDSLTRKDIISENLDKCQFVKLQTTDDCLIKWIEKIEFDDNKIFIMDENEKIFVFNNEGKFLNAIGKTGLGPEEQLTVFDFYLDKKSAIINVVDLIKSTRFKYSYSGKLLGREIYDASLLRNTSIITNIDDRYLILTLNNDNNSSFNFGILDSKKMERKDYIPYLATGNMTVGFGREMAKVAKSKEFVYMCAFMSDTIYKYDANSGNILPEWVFKGKLPPATKKSLEGKPYDLALDALTAAKTKHLSTGIDILNEYPQGDLFKKSIRTGIIKTVKKRPSNVCIYWKKR
ncbi:MAG: 6-bladed beta-propeller [Candidatus Symbiothrix sp.]|jgi:hypothetical protein|nr:6-bladed beta-propeller [Candidatus Symbiothrix sp.]